MNTIDKSKNVIRTLWPLLLIIFLMFLMIFSMDKINFAIKAFLPIIYAFMFAYLLDSVVRFCMNVLHVRRQQAIFLACLAVLGIIMLIFSIIVPKIVENINAVISFFVDKDIDVNQLLKNINDRINNEYLYFISENILNASKSLQEQLNSVILSASNFLIGQITGITSKIFSIITSFIISIYMLIEKDDLIGRLKRLIYALYDKIRANKIICIGKKANIIFKSFLNGKILDAFIVGVICIILFTITKVPNSVLMGSLIGVFNIIPYFGPIIGSVPVVLISFFIEPSKALVALIIIIVVQQIDSNFIDPKIVGNNVGVTPFWVISAVIVGGALGGIVGMIFGVPVVVLIKTIIEETIEMRLIEKGMGDYEKNKLKKMKTKKKLIK